RFGLWLVGIFPPRFCRWLSCVLVGAYRLMARRRREIVIQNLLPPLKGDHAAAEKKAQELFHQFAIKLIDLWRYEAGLPIEDLFGESTGWEHLANARAQKRGVLLLTAHLGNWEFGGP